MPPSLKIVYGRCCGLGVPTHPSTCCMLTLAVVLVLLIRSCASFSCFPNNHLTGSYLCACLGCRVYIEAGRMRMFTLENPTHCHFPVSLLIPCYLKFLKPQTCFMLHRHAGWVVSCTSNQRKLGNQRPLWIWGPKADQCPEGSPSSACRTPARERERFGLGCGPWKHGAGELCGKRLGPWPHRLPPSESGHVGVAWCTGLKDQLGP